MLIFSILSFKKFYTKFNFYTVIGYYLLTCTLISTLGIDNNRSTHSEKRKKGSDRFLGKRGGTKRREEKEGIPIWPPLAAQCKAVDPDLSSPLTDTLFAKHSSKNGKFPKNVNECYQ